MSRFACALFVTLSALLNPLVIASAGAQDDASLTTEPPPEWATCERYRRLLEGDASATVPVDDLRVLPYPDGVTINHLADVVEPATGTLADPPAATAAVGDLRLDIGQDERVLSFVTLRSNTLLVALVATGIHWESFDNEPEPVMMATALELRVTTGSTPALPGLPLEWRVGDWNDARGANRQWELSQVADQLVLLSRVAYDCPGGGLQYCGWTRAVDTYLVDAAGVLSFAGGDPAQSTLNGGNVDEGAVFQFEVDHLDFDGDGVIDERVRPTWSWRQPGFEDEASEDDSDGSEIEPGGNASVWLPPIIRSDDLTSPIRTHRRLVGGVWTWVERDFSDLLLADHQRAVVRWQHGRLDATRVALGNYVLGLEMILGPRRAEVDAASLIHWLFERGPSDDESWPASRDRVREMMVGIANVLVLVEGAEPAGAATTADLRRRLRELGDFGFCPGTPEADGEASDDYEYDADSRAYEIVDLEWH